MLTRHISATFSSPILIKRYFSVPFSNSVFELRHYLIRTDIPMGLITISNLILYTYQAVSKLTEHQNYPDV